MVKRPNPPKSGFLRLAAAVLSLWLAGGGSAPGQGLPREKGAFYLEDFFHRPYRLQVLVDAPIYFNADAARFLGTVKRDEVVELQAITGNGALFRVRAKAQQGQVVGWMPARYVTPLDSSFVEGLRRATDRREQIRTLTAAGDVALNMTPEEVSAILGQPAKKSSHTDAGGSTDTWDFVRYETVPKTVVGTDALGRQFATVVYEKVPVGNYAVTFVGGLSQAIDQTDKTGVSVASTTPVKTVPPPVVFHF